ncbi:MAG: YkgJ family cysteine cluster protein [Thaumarchaeota archaeon]|nr:YkgJ family cysteine cluster protein [Nitrososphaerota archaeon]
MGIPPKNVCRNHNCVICCFDTEMPLLEEDIQQIVGLGFKQDSFTVESDGFKVLKNRDGRCVFHDGKQCTIYANRPAGCRLYPVIFDENLNRAVKDHLCPYRAEFELSQDKKRDLSIAYRGLVTERDARITANRLE